MRDAQTTGNRIASSPDTDVAPPPRVDRPRTPPGGGPLAALDRDLARARAAFLRLQADDGHWRFEFEADCTIPAEYILMMHFLDEIDEELQGKFTVYLRERQADHDGWPLYYGGDLDISCSVKCYWALKLAGDSPDAPHMVRARAAILAQGGAARCNVFTRIRMALFGQVPWRAVPFLPVEVILLPRWFPFHLSKVSYWSRTVVVPLAVLCTLRARAKNPTGIGIAELFTTPPDRERDYFPIRSRLNRVFLVIERTVRRFEPLIPGFVRRRAMRKAERWFIDRLNGLDGLGGIFPAMVNAHEAVVRLGYDYDHPVRVQCRESLRQLLCVGEHSAYCQPCLSPIWDTALAGLALAEVQDFAPTDETATAMRRAGEWLESKQVLDGPADWRSSRPDLAPGGWPFQYANDYYPDLDDTSAVVWALLRIDDQRFAESIRLGADWLCGMQSSNGGFAAFDVDNCYYYLSEIPFADHGALLDPPTADVSARCATLLAMLSRTGDTPAIRACLDFLFAEQEDNGSWFGRWGTNYVYGTWAVMMALEQIDDERVPAARERAVRWLQRMQHNDGSWGEGNDTYFEPERAGTGPEGTSFQTAWAVLALMAAGAHDTPAVRRGIEWLQATQREDGLWDERWFTAPGFPRVFYIRYHGYSRYFPLWALARYRRHVAERLT